MYGRSLVDDRLSPTRLSLPWQRHTVLACPTECVTNDDRKTRAWKPASFIGFILFSCLTEILCQSGFAQEIQPDTSGLAILAAMEDATTSAIAAAEKSVVAIARVRRDINPNERNASDPLRIGRPFPFEDSPADEAILPNFFGSGVIVDAEGFIVTCAHVLDDPRRNDYFVWLDKRSYPAKVIGKTAKVYASDPFSDLAILKVDAQGLRPISFGQTSGLKKGQFVIALGNPDSIARDGEVSASWGIISNLGRFAPSETNDSTGFSKDSVHQYGTLIQTDAKLNFGTSGGALINLRGEMIGLTTSLAARAGYENAAGFAIATDALFLRVIQTLKLGKLPEYGFLGIQPEDLRLADRQRGMSGARVSVVLPGLPGDQAGLKADDIIIEVSDRTITDSNDLFRELSYASAGDQVSLKVQRFRAGSRVPNILTLPALVSKKFVSTTRPGFALNPTPTWRGLVVEYATAVASEQTRSGLLSARRYAPPLAALSVEPGSSAWDAGLRPGHGILALNGEEISTPDDFQAAAQLLSGDAELLILRIGGRPEVIKVRESHPSEQ